MVRVAIDARLLAYQRAGTATYIRGILNGFEKAGDFSDQFVILASRRDRDPEPVAQRSRRVLWTPCHHRFERWALGLELAMLPLDVLHSPDFIPPSRLGRRWARVATIHDLAFLRFPELLTADSRLYYGQIFRAVKEAERIIAVSEATRRDLLDLAGAAPDKVVVVPEGVDDDFVSLNSAECRIRVRDRFGIDRPYFLFVGTLEPRKNLARLFQAFGAFRQRVGPNGPLLVLAGRKGWLADDLDELARPLGDAVRFLGGVERGDLIALYNGGLALILVSLYEGFGLPALEAMACGRPTLVANTASLPEVVGDAGLLVPPTDVDAIADGLQRLWEDEALRATLGENGKRRAAQFDWVSVARQTHAVYRQAVECAS